MRMKHYRNIKTNKIFGYLADGSQDFLITSDLVAISDEELNVPTTVDTYTAVVQTYLDQCAKALGYDSILTAITYAEEPAVPKFQQDGLALRAKRSLVWEYAYKTLADVTAGKINKPTPEDFLTEITSKFNEVL